MSIPKRKWLKIILACFHILNGRAMTLEKSPFMLKYQYISQIKAIRHGCRKTVDLSEQLPSCAKRNAVQDMQKGIKWLPWQSYFCWVFSIMHVCRKISTWTSNLVSLIRLHSIVVLTFINLTFSFQIYQLLSVSFQIHFHHFPLVLGFVSMTHWPGKLYLMMGLTAK